MLAKLGFNADDKKEGRGENEREKGRARANGRVSLNTFANNNTWYNQSTRLTQPMSTMRASMCSTIDAFIHLAEPLDVIG